MTDILGVRLAFLQTSQMLSREELPHAQGRGSDRECQAAMVQERKEELPMPVARGSSQKEQCHVQGTQLR